MSSDPHKIPAKKPFSEMSRKERADDLEKRLLENWERNAKRIRRDLDEQKPLYSPKPR